MRGPLEENPLFVNVAPALRERLVAASRQVRYQPGERILTEDEPARCVFALELGSVRVFHRSPTGSELLLKVFHAPALFGEAEAFSQVPFLEHVEAVESVELLIIPVDELLALMRDDAWIGFALSVDLAARLAIAIQHMKSVAFSPVTVRLANLLIEHVAWMKQLGNRELRLDITREEMALALGVTTRAIASDLALWRREGILERRGSRYVVRDLEGLRRYGLPSHLGLTYSLADRVRSISERLEARTTNPTAKKR
jgi:CRP/FNR family transcriptional regulator